MKSFAREVYVIGIGQTPVTKETDLSLGKLGALALLEAIANAGVSIEALYVGNMLSGILSHQQQLGTVIIDSAGLTGVEALTIEAACSSGGGALHMGVLAIASGMYDCVGVCGIEKMGQSNREGVTSGLATASDWIHEGSHGQTFPMLNAKMMKDYLDFYHIPHDAFGGFAINAHKNALSNPNALFHKSISQADYENSKIIEPPLCLYDACPICDGSAVVLLASKAIIETLKKQISPVRVRASTVATDTIGLAQRKSLHQLEGVRRSCQQAYQQAGVSSSDIDLFEVHDAYSVLAAISLEEAGFAEPGKGYELAQKGDISLKGRIPISTFGGLKARGHPIGATGIYQTVEMVKQLTGQAGENQVPDAVIGMTQSIGGVGGTVITHILEAA